MKTVAAREVILRRNIDGISFSRQDQLVERTCRSQTIFAVGIEVAL
jgi:hypothetical protein